LVVVYDSVITNGVSISFYCYRVYKFISSDHIFLP
jgi:hypothetical protein